MKATEVLKQYAAGKRDFRGENLRGQSFKGQNLSGADFSKCDIRGTSFKNAILKGTKFCQAKAGLQKRWTIFLALVSWVSAGFLGFLFAFAGSFVTDIFNSSSDLENRIAGWVALVVLIVLLVIFYRQGLSGEVALVGALAVALAIVVAVIVALAGAEALAAALVLAVTISVTVALVLALAVTIALALTLARAVVVAVAVALAGAEALVFAFAGARAFAVALAVTLVSAYLGWRAIKGDPKDAWIRTIAVALAATGGTSFYDADLTDVDFTGATLKNTDLRAKFLTCTRFHKTIKLDFARPGKTLLAQPAIRDLLITLNGYKKSYQKADFRGANLNGANLNEANLKYADLSEASLQDANLEGANLTEVNAVETDFTHAYFTGACIEAWNIESSTKLTNIDCRFIYLLENPKPRTDNRERRPSSGEFAPGEFTKLFQEVMDTVDIIFRNGVDWKAFIAAFKKVQVENEDTELTIQSIENKGDGVVVVKVRVPPDTNKEKIHREFNQNYDLALKALEEKYKAQLEAKDNEIIIYRQQSADLKEIIKLKASQPIQIQNINQPQGSDMSNIYQNHSGRGDNVARDKNTTYNYSSQNLTEAAAEIQQLLEQLSLTYSTNTTTEKMIVAAKAIEQIEQNSTLTKRLLSALKAGSISALEQLLNHPAASFLVSALQDWQQTKTNP